MQRLYIYLGSVLSNFLSDVFDLYCTVTVLHGDGSIPFLEYCQVDGFAALFLRELYSKVTAFFSPPLF